MTHRLFSAPVVGMDSGTGLERLLPVPAKHLGHVFKHERRIVFKFPRDLEGIRITYNYTNDANKKVFQFDANRPFADRSAS